MCGGNNNPTPPIGRPITITLTVNASALYNADPQPTTQTELDTYCSLSDDNTVLRGGRIPPNGTLNDYTTQVYSANTVSWVGVNNGDAGYRVLIDSISNNPTFFASDPPGNSGRVTAALKDGINGLIDTYTIGFTIDAPGSQELNPPKSYPLDPKLQGNPK